VSWRQSKGFADGDGGTDYRGFPTEAYFIDPADIGRPGRSELLEIPMTIAADGSAVGAVARSVASRMPRVARKAAERAFPPVSWFRPNGRNLPAMRKLLRQRKGAAYIVFMLHSSELMPGCSPTFPTERSIDRLYDQLEQLFEEAQGDYRGAKLAEFRGEFVS
jgi:hypothetical protein